MSPDPEPLLPVPRRSKVPTWWCPHNATRSTTPSCSNLVRARGPELLTQEPFPADRHPRHPRLRAQAPSEAPGGVDDLGLRCIQSSMDAVGSYIPTPGEPVDKRSSMRSENVRDQGRGTVATGASSRGVVKVGDDGRDRRIRPTARWSSPASRCSRSCSTRARPATTLGCLLRGIEREDIERGQVLAKAGSVKPTRSSPPGSTSDQGGGRPANPVLQRLPAQFYSARPT